MDTAAKTAFAEVKIISTTTLSTASSTIAEKTFEIIEGE